MNSDLFFLNYSWFFSEAFPNHVIFYRKFFYQWHQDVVLRVEPPVRSGGALEDTTAQFKMRNG